MAITPDAAKTVSSSMTNEQKQKRLLWIFFAVGLALVLILYFWLAGGKKPEQAPIGGEVAPLGASKAVSKEIKLEDIKFDTAFLKTEKFKALKVFGSFPIKIETKGRPNPFATF